MNKSFFDSMQSRLAPDGQVVDRLMERIEAGEPARKSRPVRAYAAAAACLAVAIAAAPVYRALKPAPLHSYVTGEEYGVVYENTAATGEIDLGALPEGAESESEPPEIETEPGEDGETNTGDLPGGAYVGEIEPLPEDGHDVPAGEEAAINAYSNLMARFEADYGYDNYPEWFGGAYLVRGGFLMVCVVDSAVPEEYLIDVGGDKTPDKAFYLLIQEWAGDGRRTDAVGFAEVKYSLNFLRGLQERITALPQMQGLASWGCGVDEMKNRVELTVPRADRDLLAALAELDPDDDAILVQTGETVTLGE